MRTPTVPEIVITFVITSLLASAAIAQPSRTGTNLNAKAIPSEVLMLQQPDEVERIRQLMMVGRKSDARIAAEEYIEKVERNALRQEKQTRYYAWNAYCTVLTSLQRVEDAIAACSTAMALEPGKWSAVNNRGTAKFVGGRWNEALADYNSALGMVDVENEAARDTIEHNIALVRERR